MAQRIQIRRDTAAQWVANNPTLSDGEIGIETDTLKLKIGNGVAAWNDLSYGLYATVDDFTVFQDTITTLISTVTGDITTAQFTADTAQTSADAAQTTANDALSLATTAEADATNAQGTADLAEGDAQAALTQLASFQDSVFHPASDFVLASSLATDINDALISDLGWNGVNPLGTMAYQNATDYPSFSEVLETVDVDIGSYASANFGDVIFHDTADFTAASDFSALVASLGELAYVNIIDITASSTVQTALDNWLDDRFSSSFTSGPYLVGGVAGLPAWIDGEIAADMDAAFNTFVSAYWGGLSGGVAGFNVFLDGSISSAINAAMGAYAGTLGPMCQANTTDFIAVTDFDLYLSGSAEFQTMWDLAYAAAGIGTIGSLPGWVDSEITNFVAANVPFMGFRFQQRPSGLAGAPGSGEAKWDGADFKIHQVDCDGSDLLTFWHDRVTALGTAVIYIALPQSVGVMTAFLVTPGSATGSVYTFGTATLISGAWLGGFNMSYILIA